MLTGIDVGLFHEDWRLAPFIWLGEMDHAGWTHYELSPSRMQPWVELMADNGYNLQFYESNPHAPVFGMMTVEPVGATGHIVAVDHARVVDPIFPWSDESVSEYLQNSGQIAVGYIVVTPL
jgi:hypothetical protein